MKQIKILIKSFSFLLILMGIATEVLARGAQRGASIFDSKEDCIAYINQNPRQCEYKDCYGLLVDKEQCETQDCFALKGDGDCFTADCGALQVNDDIGCSPTTISNCVAIINRQPEQCKALVSPKKGTKLEAMVSNISKTESKSNGSKTSSKGKTNGKSHGCLIQ